jgi:hypothetical protein
MVTLFLMGWETLELAIMLEFLNTFMIKGIDIYFGHKDKVYVISKQLIVDVFGVCVEGYIEDVKGQVSKTLVVQTLQGCRLALANSFAYQWNTKSLGFPYSIKYPAIIFVICQRVKA